MMRGLEVIPGVIGVVALLQGAANELQFDAGFWLSQGLAVALLASVGIFFVKQIWPKLSDFFDRLLRLQEEIRDGQRTTNTELSAVGKMMSESKAEHQAQAAEHQEQAAVIRDNRDQIMQAMTKSNIDLSNAINLNSQTSERIHNANAKMWRENIERNKRMTNVTYAQVLSILEAWGGTPEENLKQWETTYNFIIPPPPPPTALISNTALAAHIASVYRGPEITG
jgi:hypothetical protein